MQLISLENKGLNFNHDIFQRFIFLTYLLIWKWHHLQTGPGPGPRPSKNRTLILWTPEKPDPPCDK